jgi:hypothetical protein
MIELKECKSLAKWIHHWEKFPSLVVSGYEIPEWFLTNGCEYKGVSVEIYCIIWWFQVGFTSEIVFTVDWPLVCLLLQRSLLPGGIILQGVLLLQVSMSIFACHYGWVPIGVIGLVTPSSPREEESITSYSCFSLGWGILLARYKEPRFYVSFKGREQSK